MAEPCLRDADLARFDERINGQDKVLMSLSSAVSKLNETLSAISSVMVENKHLHEDQHRNEKSINELYRRVRTLELSPGKTAGKAWWLLIGAMTGAAGGIVSGLVVWGVSHA